MLRLGQVKLGPGTYVPSGGGRGPGPRRPRLFEVLVEAKWVTRNQIGGGNRPFPGSRQARRLIGSPKTPDNPTALRTEMFPLVSTWLLVEGESMLP